MLKKMIICGGVLGFMMFCTLCLAEQKEWTNPSSPMESYWENPEGLGPPMAFQERAMMFLFTREIQLLSTTVPMPTR